MKSRGHGGRHLLGSSLTPAQVNPVIANDVVARNLAVNQFLADGLVKVKGIPITYTAMRISQEWINVGTYHILKK